MFFTELFFQLISSEYIVFNWLAFDTLGLIYLSFIIKILIYGIKKVSDKKVSILSFEILFSTFNILLIGLILYYLYNNTKQNLCYVKYFSMVITSVVTIWSILKGLKDINHINRIKVSTHENIKKNKQSKQNNALVKQQSKNVKFLRKQNFKNIAPEN
ncbi:hypothetical protein [Campylobacter majalis]|uniref:hypothetical protein n=1 Tax=Campylobacter majalis TaxID=2790656 RepID=UPI003D689980